MGNESGTRRGAPLLLLAAHGIGPAGLATAAGHGLRQALPATGTWSTVAAPWSGLAGALLAHGSIAGIRHRGIAVDTFGLTLRHPAATDAAALRAAARRPMGPAPVTILELRDPLAAACRDGTGSRGHLQALATAGELATEATGLLRTGEPPEVWLLLGPAPHAVGTVFDLRAAAAQALPAPVLAALSLEVHADTAVLRGSARALQIAAAWLQRHGAGARLASGRNGALHVHAAPGVAFAPGGAARPDAGDGHAFAPAAAGLPASLALGALLDAFAWRAIALHDRAPDLPPVDRPTAAAAPSGLLPLATADAAPTPSPIVAPLVAPLVAPPVTPSPR